MKKLIVMVAAIFAASLVNAQKVGDNNVPAVVKTKFASLHPEAKMEKWTNEKGTYQASFKEGKADVHVIIDAKGNLVKTKTTIESTTLPQAAMDYLTKNYPDKKITELNKIVDAAGTVTYQGEIKNQLLMFDSNGKFMKEMNEKDTKK